MVSALLLNPAILNPSVSSASAAAPAPSGAQTQLGQVSSQPNPPQNINAQPQGQGQPSQQSMSQMMMEAMELSGSQNFDDFMGKFGENVLMPQNGDPRALFAENLNFINQMNLLFLQGETSFSMAVNPFSALSFQEFSARQSGMGVFNNNNVNAKPVSDSRGKLRLKSIPNNPIG